MSNIRAKVIEAIRRAHRVQDLMDLSGDRAAQVIQDLPVGTFADEAHIDQKEAANRISVDSNWRGTQGRHMYDPVTRMTWVWDLGSPIHGKLKDS
jgi:hypothetical protein